MRKFYSDCWGHLRDHNGIIGISDTSPIEHAVEILNEQQGQIESLLKKVSELSSVLSFDIKDTCDIGFSSKIQRLLVASDFKTDSISTDEDGYSHCILFAIGNCEGEIHTERGKIVHIKTF